MKEIMAVIRMNKINQTKQALSLAGFPSVTCCKVLGRGKKKVDYQLIGKLLDGAEIESPKVAEAVSEGHRLLPKRLLMMMVKDEDVGEVVKIIIETNQTKNAGDGKIFVMPVEETYRMRTGETGDIVL
ncbi:P-II family nitrogen regulator [Bacillota bacterium LX-D]|nr:P-II family nitrogen regulator [Bacillota bacterium LX-D]